MKILIAPDKFKSCLTARQVADAIASGLREVGPDLEIDLCPIADGGEGTVAAIAAASNARLVTTCVTGPLPEMRVDAAFALLNENTTAPAAVIEMSSASGLALLRPQDRDPFNTTTFGAGELIRNAVQLGAKTIILGIGGSATNDAGIGAAQACGFTILMQDGQPTSMTEPLCAKDLPNVLMVKHGRGEITNGIDIQVACDVTNPLYGPNGASLIYGPQKGATPEMALHLDQILHDFARRTHTDEFAHYPGAGAAGGLGFGLLAFFNAKLQSGFDLIASVVKLQGRVRQADLVITGEGQLDHQSFSGKAAIGVAGLAKQHNIPCIALVGAIDPEAHQALEEVFTACFAIADGPLTHADSCSRASDLLAITAANCLRIFQAGRWRQAGKSS